MLGIAVAREARTEIKSRMPGRNHPQDRRTGNAAQHLRDDVTGQLCGLEPTPGPQADRHGRIEVTAGDVANGVGHREHGQTEGEGDPDEADPQLRIRRGQHRGAAAPEHEPRSPDEFRHEFLEHFCPGFGLGTGAPLHSKI